MATRWSKRIGSNQQGIFMHQRALVLALMAVGAVLPGSTRAADDCSQMFVYSVNQFCRTLSNGFSQCQPVGMVGPAPNCAKPGVPAIMPVPLAPPVTQAPPRFNFLPPFSAPTTAVPPVGVTQPAVSSVAEEPKPSLPEAPKGMEVAAVPAPEPIVGMTPVTPTAESAVVAKPARKPEVANPSTESRIPIASELAKPAPAPVPLPVPATAGSAVVAMPGQDKPEASAAMPPVSDTPATSTVQTPVETSVSAPRQLAPSTVTATTPSVATMPAPKQDVVATPVATPVSPTPTSPLATVVAPAPETPQASVVVLPTEKHAPRWPDQLVLQDGLAHFEFDRAELSEQARSELDAWLTQPIPKGKTLRVTGHADRLGPAYYNMKLSGRRALTVKKYLVGKGVEGTDIKVVAKGESEPVKYCKGGATKATIACLAPNRRVEIDPE